MRILLLGGGAREHALAWKIHQSSRTKQLFIAPGNPGTNRCGINVGVDISNFEAIKKFCIEKKIEMIVVGPEEPLVKGLYDFIKADNQLKEIYFIGPSKDGARLEGSKAFAKSFMLRHNIPTALYKEFSDANFEEAAHFVNQHSLPVVLKADGLAAGKGVVLCQTHVEAIAELELMLQGKFGEAGKKVVVEEFLEGIEVSVFAITDGKNYLLLPEAKDYKRIGEGDKGLNTGGMGAVSPVPFATPEFMKKVEDKVIRPTINGINKEGLVYVGFLFFGIMNVNGEPYVIEYNCRLGDPETEVVIPRLQTDLVELMIAAAEEKLNAVNIDVDERTAVTIMASSFGYPGAFERGYEITGFADYPGKDAMVFQAGTVEKEGKLITNGGRVLCVTSYGHDIQEAADKSLDILEHIHFDGMYFRKDIGYEFLPSALH
jgi:phosphoribosylamine--glycine ligase